ncbi:septal ring lytic transglycosylase RlpA family protein [Pontibacter beigongshangensis]|uniref:septal ring lytic transglycosylase RlpA family protein n=1 Tax=Pontibacter beigongshangensis TaxID=2574733 RepID=UPI0016502573|nr:septal ring lytic transglycosylase RlpA family protein [Pontibacter beigongshangensis]
MNINSIILVIAFFLNPGPAAYFADGKASFYSDRMHGHRTASGERYDKALLTAAHASLPFNTLLEVTNLKNGKTVVVKVNDRMARSRHTIIDVSKAAALQLDMVRDGVGRVQVRELKEGGESQQDEPLAVSEAEAPANQ